MDNLFKWLRAAAVALVLTGSSSEYVKARSSRDYTPAEFDSTLQQNSSLCELKAICRAHNARMKDGTVASCTFDEPLFTSGMVSSTDRFAYLYNFLYLYHEASDSAIEQKQNIGIYLFHTLCQIVYVDLEARELLNYRGLFSIGSTSYTSTYSKDNVETKIIQHQKIVSLHKLPMVKSHTLVVTRDNYRTLLSHHDLLRLVRF